MSEPVADFTDEDLVRVSNALGAEMRRHENDIWWARRGDRPPEIIPWAEQEIPKLRDLQHKIEALRDVAAINAEPGQLFSVYPLFRIIPPRGPGSS